MGRRDRAALAAVSDDAAAISATAVVEPAQLAEEIGMAALELAARARDAGLTTIAFLLESVALEAGAEAAAACWSVAKTAG